MLVYKYSDSKIVVLYNGGQSVFEKITGYNTKNDSQNVKTQDEKIAMDISEKEDIIITNGKELFSNEEGYCNIIYFDSKQIIIVEDYLLEVATPPEFEELLGARVLNYFGDSSYVYFLDSTKSNILYIFDTDQGKISKFNLTKGNTKIDNVVRDDEGNLIVTTEHTDNKCRYFLIDLDTILSKIK